MKLGLLANILFAGSTLSQSPDPYLNYELSHVCISSHTRGTNMPYVSMIKCMKCDTVDYTYNIDAYIPLVFNRAGSDVCCDKELLPVIETCKTSETIECSKFMIYKDVYER